MTSPGSTEEDFGSKKCRDFESMPKNVCAKFLLGRLKIPISRFRICHRNFNGHHFDAAVFDRRIRYQPEEVRSLLPEILHAAFYYRCHRLGRRSAGGSSPRRYSISRILSQSKFGRFLHRKSYEGLGDVNGCPEIQGGKAKIFLADFKTVLGPP